MPDLPGPPDDDASGAPAGEVYDWFRRGRELLESGDAAAAAVLLARAVEAEPTALSLREELARAQFDAGQYRAAHRSFAVIVEADPAEHYAQFGLGLAAGRLGDQTGAARHLAIATALRPDLAHYAEALRQVRATLAARERAADTAAVEGFARARDATAAGPGQPPEHDDSSRDPAPGTAAPGTAAPGTEAPGDDEPGSGR